MQRIATVAAFGARDCALPLHYALLRNPPASGCGSLHYAYGYKLSLTAAPLSAVNSKPPLAFPSRRCRSAALPSPYRTDSIHKPRSSHPQRMQPPSFLAPGIDPNPKPRCTLGKPRLLLRREYDHFAYSEQPAAHGTEGSAHSLSASPRQRACRSTSYTTPLCAVCSECVSLLRPPRLRFRRSRSTAHRQHLTPRLD